jgi:hypothetical protein
MFASHNQIAACRLAIAVATARSENLYAQILRYGERMAAFLEQLGPTTVRDGVARVSPVADILAA